VSGLEPLDRFNRLPEEEAATELLAVCHSRRRAKEVAAGRPYADLAALQQAADRDVQERLARGTAEYEARFGHVFLISAAGRDATEILAALTGRLGNDPATELRVAADEHRRITRLRLERLMQG
jgi:2-oxo-4-hydroxy-4-carboxy--5-ureidoimidazoline (OHCU) decarboxylase